MIERRPYNQLAAADDHCDAKHARSGRVTCLSIAVRGLLVTASAVGIVAYLLLTNSHI
jgi:hypothetical protein